MKKILILFLLSTLMSCGVYQKYESMDTCTSNGYLHIVAKVKLEEGTKYNYLYYLKDDTTYGLTIRSNLDLTVGKPIKITQ